MITIDKLVGDEIRKILEFEDSEGEIQRIEIKNPSKEIKDKVINVIGEDDDFSTLEFLIEELTNVELNKPLREIDEEEYQNVVLEELIKEMTAITLEIIRSFVLSVGIDSDIKEASRLLKEEINA